MCKLKPALAISPTSLSSSTQKFQLQSGWRRSWSGRHWILRFSSFHLSYFVLQVQVTTYYSSTLGYQHYYWHSTPCSLSKSLCSNCYYLSRRGMNHYVNNFSFCPGQNCCGHVMFKLTISLNKQVPFHLVLPMPAISPLKIRSQRRARRKRGNDQQGTENRGCHPYSPYPVDRAPLPFELAEKWRIDDMAFR